MPASRPPSVDALARSLQPSGLPHPLLVDIAREAIASGNWERAGELAAARARSLLQPVINATGVLLHTNLGRAPLAHHQEATYTNLELRLADGRRGSRSDHVASLLARLVEAEAALVVNNGAAALLLVLAALAGGGDGVAVSRGELVEIGGGFRVPEVMAQSGARLVEVGTTNRTRRADFARAVGAPGSVAVVLKVHQSNYRVVGFTEQVDVAELVGLGPPVVADIGSGLPDATCPWLVGGAPPWVADEPAARQTLRAGADLVTFSGDKLFGGPQAGVIAGRADLVARCAAHPLARALRPGALVLGALQTVTLAYLGRRGDEIPLWRMAARTVAELTARAEALDAGTVSTMASVPGGGTLPGVEIPSAGVCLAGDHSGVLRSAGPAGAGRPVVARVNHDRTFVDLRTVDPADDADLAARLRAIEPRR